MAAVYCAWPGLWPEGGRIPPDAMAILEVGLLSVK